MTQTTKRTRRSNALVKRKHTLHLFSHANKHPHHTYDEDQSTEHMKLTLLLLLALVVYTPEAMHRTVHGYAPVGMAAMRNTHSFWLVTIKRQDYYAPLKTTWLSGHSGEKTRPLNTTQLISEKLPRLLEQDRCRLLVSRYDERRVLLEFYCQDAGRLPEADRLRHTLGYLKEQYGEEWLFVERNRPWRPPKPASVDQYMVGVNGEDPFTLKYLFAGRERLHANLNPETNPKLHVSDFTQSGVTWGLNRIVQPTGELNGQYVYDNTAGSIDAYIVDTGIQVSHVEFQGRALFYYNAVDNIDTDCLGHGTHVAGIVGSQTYGVAKNITLVAIKVLDCTGEGTTATIADGLSAVLGRIAAVGRKCVINLSLGGDKSASLDDIILEIAQQNNTMVVVAAGNDGGDACQYSPSDLGQSDLVLSVSASTQSNACPTWANTGACVDLSAPGNLILSTWIGASNTSTAILSGTSMAAPFVTGAVAMLLEQQGNLSVAELYALVTSETAMDVVSETSSDGGGKNLLNSLMHLDAIHTQAPTPVPTAQPTAPIMQIPDNVDSGSTKLSISFLTVAISLFMLI